MIKWLDNAETGNQVTSSRMCRVLLSSFLSILLTCATSRFRSKRKAQVLRNMTSVRTMASSGAKREVGHDQAAFIASFQFSARPILPPNLRTSICGAGWKVDSSIKCRCSPFLSIRLWDFSWTEQRFGRTGRCLHNGC